MRDALDLLVSFKNMIDADTGGLGPTLAELAPMIFSEGCMGLGVCGRGWAQESAVCPPASQLGARRPRGGWICARSAASHQVLRPLRRAKN